MDGIEDNSLDASASTSQQAQRQVRLKLTSRHEDIALPESTGPILVPTGKFLFRHFTGAFVRYEFFG